MLQPTEYHAIAMLENTIMQYFLLIEIGCVTNFYFFQVARGFNYNFLVRIVDCCGIYKCLLISFSKLFNICNIIERCVGVHAFEILNI